MFKGSSATVGPRFGSSILGRSSFAGVGMVLAGLSIVCATFVAAGASPRDDQREVAAVRSSLAPGLPVRVITAASRKVRSNPWKLYLADDDTCPEGDRADLVGAQRAATVACLVNFARKRHGLQRLTVRSNLSLASADKVRAMVRCQNFAHDPCGTDGDLTVRANGYDGSFGENLYLATGRWATPRAAVDAWLNSAPHRENLLSPMWRDQGLAIVSLKRFARYRDVSLWVSILAAPG